jgi:site-specific DNA-methyltransferase (adenine-specific)
LYKDLGQFAVRVLRPGGWLLAYAGQAHFPAVLDAIRVDGLQYAWMFCILHSGGDLRFRNFKLQNHWKPIIAMYKPPLTVTWDWFPDTLSGGKEKDLHPWQQAEREASHFIDRLSAPGGFVCDPFAGSGTTLSAAKKLKRRWLGFETSQEHIASARERLSA